MTTEVRVDRGSSRASNNKARGGAGGGDLASTRTHDIAIFHELCNQETVNLKKELPKRDKPARADEPKASEPAPAPEPAPAIPPPEDCLQDVRSLLGESLAGDLGGLGDHGLGDLGLGDMKLGDLGPEEGLGANRDKNGPREPSFRASDVPFRSPPPPPHSPPVRINSPLHPLAPHSPGRAGSPENYRGHQDFRSPPPPPPRRTPSPPPVAFHNHTDGLELDKASLLHEIRQLQLLNPGTALVARDVSMSDSYETLQLTLFQARQSVEISSGVNTMKNFLKIGCTGIELCSSKFSRGYVDLNGWSSEVAAEINGDSYNAPLQQIYRRYWRNGGQGMNPFLQLALLLVGSAAVFAIKRKFFGGSQGLAPPPPPPRQGAAPSTAMPHNRPTMKRPTPAPHAISEVKPDGGGGGLDFTEVDTGDPAGSGLGGLAGAGMMNMNPDALAASLSAMAPLMQSVGPMLSAMSKTGFGA